MAIYFIPVSIWLVLNKIWLHCTFLQIVTINFCNFRTSLIRYKDVRCVNRPYQIWWSTFLPIPTEEDLLGEEEGEGEGEEANVEEGEKEGEEMTTKMNINRSQKAPLISTIFSISRKNLLIYFIAIYSYYMLSAQATLTKRIFITVCSVSFPSSNHVEKVSSQYIFVKCTNVVVSKEYAVCCFFYPLQFVYYRTPLCYYYLRMRLTTFHLYLLR